MGVVAPPILVYVSGHLDVQWGYGVLTHGQINLPAQVDKSRYFHLRWLKLLGNLYWLINLPSVDFVHPPHRGYDLLTGPRPSPLGCLYVGKALCYWPLTAGRLSKTAAAAAQPLPPWGKESLGMWFGGRASDLLGQLWSPRPTRFPQTTT